MENLDKYSMLDDQGNLIRVSAHGPSIDDIEINSAKPNKEIIKTKKSIVRFEFHEVEEDYSSKINRKKNSKNLKFFGELKNINFLFSERRYTKNVYIEMNMEAQSALNAMLKFKKTKYMCARITLPGEKIVKINSGNIKKTKLRKIFQFSIMRIFGKNARVKIVVAQ